MALEIPLTKRERVDLAAEIRNLILVYLQFYADTDVDLRLEDDVHAGRSWSIVGINGRAVPDLVGQKAKEIGLTVYNRPRLNDINIPSRTDKLMEIKANIRSDKDFQTYLIGPDTADQMTGTQAVGHWANAVRRSQAAVTTIFDMAGQRDLRQKLLDALAGPDLKKQSRSP